jgi:hypothetical protein
MSRSFTDIRVAPCSGADVDAEGQRSSRSRRMPHRFGSRAVSLDHFLSRLADLSPADHGAVVRAWSSVQRLDDAWAAAEDAVGDAVARSGRTNELWRLQELIYGVFQRANRDAWRTPARLTQRTDAAAQYLATAAAGALLVADVIDQRHVATLYAPYRAVIPCDDARPRLVDDAHPSAAAPNRAVADEEMA